MLPRVIQPWVEGLARQYPVVTLVGPRQSGKTTLARALFPHKPYRTLEDPDQRRFALEDPRGFLAGLPDGAILDEVQRAPDIAAYLQGLVDADPRPGRFILTGRQQFVLMRGVTQSLAGRTGIAQLLPLSLSEAAALHPQWDVTRWLLTGFYPRIHQHQLNPSQALADYFATYVERDLRELAAVQDLHRFERFVRLCAGRVGQVLNVSGLALDAGVSQPTAQAWLDLLQTSDLVRLLRPWHVNTTKRLVKSPKLYFCDVGLVCWLLGLREPEQVARDPLYGALFENLVVMEALKDRLNHGDSAPLYYYRDAVGHEVDLLLPEEGRWRALEIKAGATVNPDYFKGLHQFTRAHGNHLHGGGVVYGGSDNQSRSDWPVWSWRSLLAGRPS